MSNIVIEVKNLSKQYRLGNVGTGSLAHDLNRMWHRFRGNEDPYLKISDENDRTVKSKSKHDYVWALKNINFQVTQGEALGIIGRNGAGKSTLLKILSRTTSPTIGSVKIRGRVASLLEVGTGFHPELTGRENVFLNGAILGMTKQEIKSKFDEIVEFSGVERYIDTPVKRYSSGMYVRLAFGVAAHLEPEILIVDEVLAVGDAEFQKKAMGKMKDVTGKEGRTILFVSHNLLAISTLCNKLIYLNNGSVISSGKPQAIINQYLSENTATRKSVEWYDKSTAPAADGITVLNAGISNNSDSDTISINQKITISISYRLACNKIFNINFILRLLTGEVVFESPSQFKELGPGCFKTEFEIPPNLLNANTYSVQFNFYYKGPKLIFHLEDLLKFEVNDNNPVLESSYFGGFQGIIRPQIKSTFVKI
ncbi:MAG: ABC transporter ATP-binding protein [Ginsengibacter sp.]